MDERQRNIAVIGGGMAGVAAARRLAEAGCRPTIFEAGPTLGGRTSTVEKGGFLFDVGAITLSPAYVRTMDLLRGCDADDLMQVVQPVLAIARGGKLHEIDLSNLLSSIRSFDLVPKRRVARLLRLLPTVVRHWKSCTFSNMADLAPLDGETTRSFAMRHLGAELHDFLVDPIIKLNMFSTTDVAPTADFVWLLRILGATSLWQVRGGMRAMAEAISRDLDVRLSTAVSRVQEEENAVLVKLDNGDTARFAAVVVAVPPPIALAIAPSVSGAHRDFLEGAKSITSTTVQLGLAVRPDVEAAVIMVPTSEHPDLMTIVLDHNKSPDRAPAGKGLVSIHLGDAWTRQNENLDEAATIEAAIRIAAPFIGEIGANVIEVTHVHRWNHVDHVHRVGGYKKLKAMVDEPQRGRVILAGDYFSAGIEGAVISGEKAAAAILRSVN